ncbi:hypothetical protein E6H29_02485 [Candidatus Bathyarchaeota archaeon]|nr:MAG: hypothetical protein E6H29_02485 [Candidatus Bathyarchaeota archaeon]
MPPGKITKALRGTDGDDYCLVELDSPVRYMSARTGEKWVLTDVAITSHMVGIPLDRLLWNLEDDFSGVVPVRILKPLVPLEDNDPVLDLSKAEEFALGRVLQVRERNTRAGFGKRG